jgi:epoxyqueuosine reductase
VKQAARDAGFELVGIAPVYDFEELDRFREWIAAGRAGEMKYMEARNEAGNLKRSSLRSTVPWARSVVVCAINYNTAQPYSTQVEDPDRGWIARYAWGHEDYHDAVIRRLRVVEDRLRHAVPESSTLPLQTWCYVDTGPIVERVYAKYAGVGWIGKNTCIMNQKIGSWLFLGVILTSLELEPDLPAPDRCGTCTRCIDACPTDALIAPYQLDSNLCISYLTIEKRGAIPEEMLEGLGRHVFGCDICQDVCPWNRGVERRRAGSSPGPAAEPHISLVDWLRADAAELRLRYDRLFVPRNDGRWLRRNALVAAGNVGGVEERKLVIDYLEDDDEMLREHAAWALARLDERGV